MDLIGFLRQEFDLPANICSELELAFTCETLPKHHKLLLPDAMSKKVYFIESGLVRAYYIKDDKDITHSFFAENSFSLSIESVFYNTPSPHGFELLEPCTLRWIYFNDLEIYINRYNQLEKLMRVLLIDVMKKLSERMYMFQFQSAQERYKTMLEKHPDILLRAPLGHIASYIGITQQRLSVIRSQK
ncbi:Crp/Fnr family transcriptional regulator [Chitinophaga sp.]|uniref:Crp/Fnr family transcriptional regulator n=1 Tax=Chitinophaga sp. TaxID=1869181 RepID=UPI0031DC0F76